MAKTVNQNAVSVLPPTIGIKDPSTRSFLDALTNILDARSGYTDRDAPERFITAAEFQGLATRAISRAFSGAGALPGDPDGKIPSAIEVQESIENLADSIRKSLIYQILGEQFGLIDVEQIRQNITQLIGRADGLTERADDIISRVDEIVIDLESGFTEEREARIDADEVLTSSLDAAVSRIGASEAAIIEEQTTRASADSVMTSSLNAAVSRIGAAESAIVAEKTTRANADSALTTSMNAAVSRIGAAESAIVDERTTRASADAALTSTVNAVTARVGAAESAIASERTTRSTKDISLASAINTIWATVGGSQAVIQDGALASATPNSAQATKWNQVQSAVRDPNTGQTASASILQETRTYASNADSKFNGIYSVRAQVSVGGKTVVGGFGLSATAGASSDSGPTIDFGVRADKFFIAATSATPDAQTQINQGSSIPFMVLTSSQWVNGVVYGPGVYIKKAVIGEATIGSAQIADLAVTNAKVGNVIQSNNYSPGREGWRIQKSGDAEFNGIVLSRPNIVRSGVFDANRVIGTQILVSSDSKGGNLYRHITKNDAAGEFIIDTGYNVYEDVGASKGPGFVGRIRAVVGGSWHVWWSGGQPLDPWFEVYPDVSVGFWGTWGSIGGVWTGEYGRVFLRVRVSVELLRPNINRIRMGNFTWELVRLT